MTPSARILWRLRRGRDRASDSGRAGTIIAETNTALESPYRRDISLIQRLHDMGRDPETNLRTGVAVMYSGRIAEIGPVPYGCRTPCTPIQVLMGAIPTRPAKTSGWCRPSGIDAEAVGDPAGLLAQPRCALLSTAAAVEGRSRSSKARPLLPATLRPTPKEAAKRPRQTGLCRVLNFAPRVRLSSRAPPRTEAPSGIRESRRRRDLRLSGRRTFALVGDAAQANHRVADGGGILPPSGRSVIVAWR